MPAAVEHRDARQVDDHERRPAGQHLLHRDVQRRGLRPVERAVHLDEHLGVERDDVDRHVQGVSTGGAAV